MNDFTYLAWRAWLVAPDVGNPGESFRARPVERRTDNSATPALCGDPGSSQFTTERRYVSRPGLLAESELRLADPTQRGPVVPRPSARVA
jgi:hypothetical protein